MRDRIVHGTEEELRIAEERIKELEKDLALNAKMLARQCDMAREAETKALEAEARAKELEAAIKDAIDRLEDHEHQEVHRHIGHVNTVYVVSRSELCDVLDDLKGILEEQGENDKCQ